MKYELPEINFFRFRFGENFKKIVVVVVVSLIFGFLGGAVSTALLMRFGILKYPQETKTPEKEYVSQASQEQAIISAVKKASPAVVSIIIAKDLPVIEQFFFSPFPDFFGPEFQIPQFRQKGTQKQQVGGGTGFIVSQDGLILTNKHVVSDGQAEYTVLANDGKKYPAKVLAKDPIQDLALIKISQEEKIFSTLALGDSDKLQMGQTVIAIGNALGEFQNTVSVGVISGLGRAIVASGGGLQESLEDVIQTDAAINLGNSGGPLLNLNGEVIGINTAISQEGQNIGFAIPINRAKRDVQSVESSGRIIYPFLGIRYILKEEGGVLIGKDSEGNPAIFPNSPAEKSGLKEGDIILEFNGEKITSQNKLDKIISKYQPGDSVFLKVLRDNQEIFFNIILAERE